MYFCSLYLNSKEYLQGTLSNGLRSLLGEDQNDLLQAKQVEDIYDEVLEEEKQKKWGKKKVRTATAKKRAKKMTYGMNDTSNLSEQWWDWWLGKAITRYEKLIDEQRYQEDQLWYEPEAEQIEKIGRWLGSKGRKRDFSDFKF